MLRCGHTLLKRQALFDACYVLNLDCRTDRWAHVQAQVKKSRLAQFINAASTTSPSTEVCEDKTNDSGGFERRNNITRVSGVDGTTLDFDALRQQGVLTGMGYQRLHLPTEQKLFGMDLTPGAVGCALGHRKVWEKIVEAKHDAALVLEDDVEFHPRLHRLLPGYWSRVPADWGVVYLGGLDLLAKGKPPRPSVAEGVRRAYQGHRELTAYVLNAPSAQRCLDLSTTLTWQIDTHICNNFAHDETAKDEYIADPLSYVFQPALAIQITSMGTDVQKQPASNPPLEDATRRMREFVEGGTSVRVHYPHKGEAKSRTPGEYDGGRLGRSADRLQTAHALDRRVTSANTSPAPPLRSVSGGINPTATMRSSQNLQPRPQQQTAQPRGQSAHSVGNHSGDDVNVGAVTTVGNSAAGVGSRGGGISSAVGAGAYSGSTLSARAVSELDKLRDNTIGLLTRHLDDPLLRQSNAGNYSLYESGKASQDGTAEHALTPAETAATAEFFRKLPLETRRLYEAAHIAELTRQAKHQGKQQPMLEGYGHVDDDDCDDDDGITGGALTFHHQQQRLKDCSSGRGAATKEGMLPASPTAGVSSRPRADDRITAQTLHLLLGKSRVAAEKVLPPALSSMRSRYYTFNTLSPKMTESAEAALFASKSTAAGNAVKHMSAAIKHREPPEMTLASAAGRYYYHSSKEGEDGNRAAHVQEHADGVVDRDSATFLQANNNHNTAWAEREEDPVQQQMHDAQLANALQVPPPAVTLPGNYHTQMPDKALSLLQYPPVPIQYASVDARKQAMTRKRLGLPQQKAPSTVSGEATEKSTAAAAAAATRTRSGGRHKLKRDSSSNSGAAMASANAMATLPDIQKITSLAPHERHTLHANRAGGAATGTGGSQRQFSDTARTATLFDEEQQRWVNSYTPLDFDAVDAPASRQAASTTLQFALTAAATRGDDTALVKQLVKLYDEQLAAEQQQQKQHQRERRNKAATASTTGPREESTSPFTSPTVTLTAEALQELPISTSIIKKMDGATGNGKSVSPAAQPPSPYPMLEAVLSVSREFEQSRVAATNDTKIATLASSGRGGGTQRWLDAGSAAHDRQRVLARLASLHSTLVPEQYWVTVQQTAALSTRGFGKRSTASQSDKAEGEDDDDEQNEVDGEEVDGGNASTTALANDLTAGAQYTARGSHGLPTIAFARFRGSVGTNGLATTTQIADTVLRASYVPQTGFGVSNDGTGIADGTSRAGLVVFPAPRPLGRAQVYLLAETIDYMLTKDPTWLPTLADRNIAYAILPPLPPASSSRNLTLVDGSGEGLRGVWQQQRSPLDTVDGPLFLADANASTALRASAATVSVEHANTLVDPEQQWHSCQAHEAYARAATEVLRVLDMGFVEVVRQVACQCGERAALLDMLRQTALDVADSSVRIMNFAKERAFEEATARVAIREELTDVEQQLSEAHQKIADLVAEREAEEAERLVLVEKAGRLDELVTRVAAKRQRHEIHSEDEHACVLKELEKQLRQSASEALDTLFEEKCRLAGIYSDHDDESDESSDDDDDEGEREEEENAVIGAVEQRTATALLAAGAAGDNESDTDRSAFLTKGSGGHGKSSKRAAKKKQKKISKLVSGKAAADAVINEAPSAQEARKRVSEQKKAAGTLYQQSHQLLRTLREATDAMNAASAPLYDKVVLNTVSPAANVATSRWAAIARSVGAFERDKSHRQKVFSVFCAWCERYQRQPLLPTAGGGADDILTAAMIAAGRRSAGDGGGDFLVSSPLGSETGGGFGGSGGRHRGSSLCDESAASFMSLPSANASIRDVVANVISEVKEEKKEVEQLAENTRRLCQIQYITSVDLAEMEVTDCTAEEINLLFTSGFDFKKYLHPTWKQQQQRQQQKQLERLRQAQGGKGEQSGEPINEDDLLLLGINGMEDFSGPPPSAGSAAAGVAGASGDWSLTLSDVAEMLQDVQATVKEMTLRLRAMADSAILKKGVQPPMQPPARPEDPCLLCGRCDTLTEERKRRQDALRQVAREVQKRLDALTEKCQRAEAEREDARGDARRLRGELQDLKQQQEEQQTAQQRNHGSGDGVRPTRSSFDGGDCSSSGTGRTSSSSRSSSRGGVSAITYAAAPRGIIKRRVSGGSNSTTNINSGVSVSSPMGDVKRGKKKFSVTLGSPTVTGGKRGANTTAHTSVTSRGNIGSGGRRVRIGSIPPIFTKVPSIATGTNETTRTGTSRRGNREDEEDDSDDDEDDVADDALVELHEAGMPSNSTSTSVSRTRRNPQDVVVQRGSAGGGSSGPNYDSYEHSHSLEMSGGGFDGSSSAANTTNEGSSVIINSSKIIFAGLTGPGSAGAGATDGSGVSQRDRSHSRRVRMLGGEAEGRNAEHREARRQQHPQQGDGEGSRTHFLPARTTDGTPLPYNMSNQEQSTTATGLAAGVSGSRRRLREETREDDVRELDRYDDSNMDGEGDNSSTIRRSTLPPSASGHHFPRRD